MPKKSKHYTKLPGYVCPNKESIKKAKDSLGIPVKVKLPRCMAKSVGKVKKFAAGGGIPDFGRGVAASGDDTFAVGRESERDDSKSVTGAGSGRLGKTRDTILMYGDTPQPNTEECPRVIAVRGGNTHRKRGL